MFRKLPGLQLIYEVRYFKIMRRIIIIIACLLLGSCSKDSSNHAIELQTALSAFANLKNDYQLHLIDHNILRSPKLKKIKANFYHFGEIDILEARLIIHRSTEHILDAFNSLYNSENSYHHYPLTQKDLEITISFVDPVSHKMHAHGAISHTALIGGRVHYSTYVENKEKYETVLQESFALVKKD